MPILTLKTAPLIDTAARAPLAQALTDITHRTLGKRRDLTAVVIEDLPAAGWAVGGQPATLPTVFLEISITAGTNSAEEKAAFMAAAWGELQRQLGDRLMPASYIVVRELPATDWGWGGRTQAARLADRAAVAA
ncbi:MAG: tautomerase family protein [Pseudomonadota bacterium]